MINAPTTGQIAVHPLPFDVSALDCIHSVEVVYEKLTLIANDVALQVPVLQCYSDFIRYLFKGTEDWFKSNYPDGEAIWNKLSRKIKLVLAHPNGWTLSSQGFLKEAVQKSGVMDALGSELVVSYPPCSVPGRGPSLNLAHRSRLIMVTEGEASVHFALFHTANEGSQWLSVSARFAV